MEAARWKPPFHDGGLKNTVVSTEKSGLFCFITHKEPPARVALFYSAKLHTDRRDVLHSLGVAHSSSDVSVEKHVSYGTHLFEHTGNI